MVRDNLSLSASLLRAARDGLITSSHLLPDPQLRNLNPATVRSIGDELVPTPVPRPTRADMERRMNNQARSSFAFAVLQAQMTLQQVFPTSPLQEPDPDLRAARCVILLLEASLRGSLLNPVWDCPPAYRESFEVSPVSFVLDATGIDGQPVAWEQFGGLEKFVALLGYCADWVEPWAASAAGQPRTGMTVEPLEEDTPWRATREKGKLETGTYGSGVAEPGPQTLARRAADPVANFVESRCYVGVDAQCPASSLYKEYRDWCDETGRQSLPQRSFGMGLTKLGFQRRRRAQGYHWWQGITLAK